KLLAYLDRRRILAGILVFLTALALRCLYLWEIRRLANFLITDSLYYHRWALKILQGDWIGQGIFEKSPLYAYFLAFLLSGLQFLRDPLLWVRFLQAVMGALGCVLIARLTRQAGGSRAEGYLAGFLAACYGPFIFYDTMLMKTFLATFLSLACLLFLYRSAGVRWGRLLAAGFFMGLTSLVRDNFILILPFFLVGLIPILPAPRSRSVLRAAGWIVFGAALVITPVTARNYLVGGEFAPLTAGGGEVFYIGNHPEANGRYRPPCFPIDGRIQCVQADSEHEHDDFRRIAGGLQGKTLTPMESSRFWFRKGIAFILNNPGQYLALQARKLGIFLQDQEIGDNYDYDTFRRISRVLSLPLPTFGLVMSLGLVGMVASFSRWKRFSLLYASWFGYTATVLLFFNFSRFRIPAVAMLIPFASVGLIWLGNRTAHVYRATRRDGLRAGGRQAGPLLVGVVAVAILFPVSLRRGPAGPYASAHEQVLLGYLLRLTGRPAEALQELDRARYLLGDAPIGDRPELLEGAPVEAFREKLTREKRRLGINFRMVHARLYEGIGLAYRDLGDWNRAAGNLEKSLEILGSGVTTLEHLAFSYRQAGDLAASAEALERALAIAEVFEIRYDLAATYLELGQARQAFETLSAAPERDPGLNREQQADYHFGLGWILFNGLSRQEEARRHFERFLELAPDDPQGLEIRRILETPGDEPG
ncbi:MAG: tetratricopeptide repeat protein, partial [Acidobacteriota bacterium]